MIKFILCRTVGTLAAGVLKNSECDVGKAQRHIHERSELNIVTKPLTLARHTPGGGWAAARNTLHKHL